MANEGRVWKDKYFLHSQLLSQTFFHCIRIKPEMMWNWPDIQEGNNGARDGENGTCPPTPHMLKVTMASLSMEASSDITKWPPLARSQNEGDIYSFKRNKPAAIQSSHLVAHIAEWIAPCRYRWMSNSWVVGLSRNCESRWGLSAAGISFLSFCWKRVSRSGTLSLHGAWLIQIVTCRATIHDWSLHGVPLNDTRANEEGRP